MGLKAGVTPQSQHGWGGCRRLAVSSTRSFAAPNVRKRGTGHLEKLIWQKIRLCLSGKNKVSEILNPLKSVRMLQLIPVKAEMVDY